MAEPPIVYAYVDGSDLEGVAETLHAAFERFLESREWSCDDVWLVDQGREDDLWELGLNLVPGSGDAWLADLRALLAFLDELHERTRRDFIVGVGFPERRIAEDVIFIDDQERDADEDERFLVRVLRGR